MKKKLNFLCIMMLVLMIVGMVMTCLASASDFKQGFEDGANATEPASYEIVGGFVFMASLLVYLYALACFVRFILCVNRGEVFTWTNVDLLRTVGRCIVVTTIVMGSALSFSDIGLLDIWPDTITIIIAGIFILIMAEAFSIGLKLKEEQDLTI